jgi:hypothetical protein
VLDETKNFSVKIKRSLLALFKTGSFKRWRKKKIVGRARNLMMLFKHLQPSDFRIKHQFLPHSRHLAISLAKVDLWDILIIPTILIFFFIITIVLILIGTPIILIQWLGWHLSSNWLLFYLLYIFTAVLVFGLVFALPLYYLWPFPAAIWGISVFSAYLIALYRIASKAQIISPNVFIVFLMSVILAQIGVLVAGIIFGILDGFIRFIIKKVKNASYPDAVLVYGLLQILSQVEKKPKQWADLVFKRQVINKLEEIARCVQYNLPRQLRSGDAGTDSWFKETTKQIAAALREQKKLILTPKPDSRDQFIAELSTNLIQATSGNWDGLKKVKPEKFSFTQIWHGRLSEFLRALFSAGLPLLILWGIQQTSLAFQGNMLDTIKVLVITGGIMRLLIALDPISMEKTSALKDIIQLLPIQKKTL